MGRIRKTEKQIIKSIMLQDESAVRAFRIMLSYFKMHDVLEHTNHTSTIRELYLNKRNFNKSNTALMLVTHLGDGTFYKYRNMYLDCFKLIQSGEFSDFSEAAFTHDFLYRH